ncbi:hypothetical protein [Pseudomonas tussilaginis]|uniref:hypothetical protein n=1 Tax=Pseudomonas putida TaxID=303 RepID=UPI00236493C3|nr:hypothetical protein [Pseudomonas putida]MDD1979288.1 hypothetical protein [Pseudomonas putida]
MQNRKGINWRAWILAVICIGQALYIYISAPSRPEPTEIVTVTKVGSGGAIYEILYNSGGATVPLIYRYFLMDVKKSDKEALLASEKSTPFLVTKSTQAVREIHGERVKLKTDNTIYDFHNISIFKVDGKINRVSFDLESITP